MIVGKHHIIFDEYTYDRQSLAKLYTETFEPECVVQYAVKKDWGADKRHGWTPGYNAVDPRRIGKDSLLDFPEIAEIASVFNFANPMNKHDVDILVFDPPFEFIPHVDFKTTCVVMFPILPADGGEPVKFWSGDDLIPERRKKYPDLDEKYFDYSLKYSTKHPNLFNGMVIHSVPAVQQRRVYMKFHVIHNTFQDLLAQAQAGTLLNL
jgi:hypothetical protein